MYRPVTYIALFGLWSAVAVACAQETSVRDPELRMTPANSVLRLPPAMHRALDSYAPGYIPWRWDDYTLNVQHHVQTAEPPWGELPMFGVIGDFNGDGEIDVALSGHDGRRVLFFVVLSDGRDYRVVELRPPEPWEAGRRRPDFLHRVPPGPVAVPAELAEGPPLVLTADGVGWVYEGQAGGVYYWRGDRFEFVLTGD